MDNEFQNNKILVVDDEVDTLKIVSHYLTGKGYEVHTSCDGQEGLRAFFEQRTDLIILDVMMPGLTGIEVCERIRELSDVPIIMFTVLRHDNDIIRGLEAGADDYVVKSVNFDVLLARIRAALRRAKVIKLDGEPTRYDDSYLSIDLVRRRVLVRQEPVKLSKTEFKLLTYLMQHANRALSSRQILAHVWGEGYQNKQEYLHTYIWQLRQKLENDPTEPTYLLTEHSMGYRFEMKEATEP